MTQAYQRQDPAEQGFVEGRVLPDEAEENTAWNAEEKACGGNPARPNSVGKPS